SRAARRRVAEQEPARRSVIDAARFQILERARSFGMAEKNFLIVGGGALVDAVKMLALTGAVVFAAPLAAFDGDAVTLGHPLHRLGEAQLIVLHQKIEDAAAGVAAEAVIDALVFAHGEGRSFLAVKGAEAEMVAPGLFQSHVIRDHFDDRSAGADLGDLFLADHRERLKAARRAAARRARGPRSCPCESGFRQSASAATPDRSRENFPGCAWAARRPRSGKKPPAR